MQDIKIRKILNKIKQKQIIIKKQNHEHAAILGRRAEKPGTTISELAGTTFELSVSVVTVHFA